MQNNQKFNWTDLHLKNDNNLELLSKINDFKLKQNLIDNNSKYKINDIISFNGGFNDNIKYISKIFGFDNEENIYVIWDCYWVPLKDDKIRDIKIVKEISIKEKIELLSIEIRNKIPRLMELKHGCKVITNTNDRIITIGYDCFDISSDNVIIDAAAPSYSNNKYRKITQIIGADPMLNHVLEWFLLLNGNPKINNSKILDCINLSINNISIDIDLTKQYLKDWDQNVINFFFKLI